MKRHRIVLNVKWWIHSLLNKFCFSKRHDYECNGCVFKNLHQCPITRIKFMCLKGMNKNEMD